MIQQLPFAEVLEYGLYVAGSILATVLVALSIHSYYKTRMKKLIYAAIAFLLFGIFLVYESLEHFYGLDNAFTDLVVPIACLAVIFFFFLAVTKKP
ncbi:MAG TPA: hypothetical protein VIA09_07275 [Nitrososphaeraceae archaeon]